MRWDQGDERQVEMSIVVVGVGNPLMGEEGAGVHVARKINALIQSPEVDVVEYDLSGPSLLDLVEGYDTAIVVDSVKTDTGFPGNVYRYDVAGAEGELFPGTIHLDPIVLGGREGFFVPSKMILYGIEIGRVGSFVKGCGAEAEEAITRVVTMIVSEIRKELFALEDS